MKLIAGIDPGMITGVAVVSIGSEFYSASSRRSLTFSEICDHLVALGEPIIISVDTVHIPETVKRVAAAFGARIYSPKRDLYIGEKKSIVSGKITKNDHERDSLAAALSAKSFFSALFRKVEANLERKALGHLADDVKELLVKQDAGNIEQAVRLLLGKKRNEIKVVPRLIETRKVLELRRELERMEKENLSLKKIMELLKKENAVLRHPPRINESVAISNLRKSIAALRREKEVVEEEYALYRNLPEHYEILAEHGEEALKNKIVLFKDGMDIARLEKLEPKAIITEKFLQTSIPLIHPRKIKVEKMGNFHVASKEEIAGALGKESFIEWLSQYKEMRKNEAQKP
jgi:predicted RNase H-like nuclease (RuvC/YqgF family)